MQATLDRIDSPEGFILDPSLILFLPLYRLDGASFMSKDAYGHLCTNYGSIWTLQGRSFDGVDDYVNCGNKPSLNITDAITIEVWIYWVGVTSYGILVDKMGSGSSAGYCMYAYKTDDTLHFHLTTNVQSTDDETSANTLTHDTWHHVVVTYDGAAKRFYIDGVLSRTVSPRTGLIAHTLTDPVTIGRRLNYNYLFKGLIGEVRIYNGASTSIEIQHRYLATKWRHQ